MFKKLWPLLLLTFPRADAAPLVTAEHQIALTALRQEIRTWVSHCDGAMNYGPGCDQGDLVLFAGMLCLTGETERCEDVRRAQAPDGSWWRAPKRIGVDGHPAFSRDQAMGLLAYFVATHDRTSAQHWQDWVYSNGRKYPDIHSSRNYDIPGLSFYSLCKDDFHVNCLLMPPLWGLIGRIWPTMGLALTSVMESGQAFNEDENALVAEAQFDRQAYERHLTAVNVLIRRMMGRNSDALTRSASVLAKRQPTNPFFQYLSQGPSDEVAQMILAQCPSRPLVADPGDWLWMADSPALTPFTTSMGWDCIFMVNLFLGNVR